MTLAAMEPETLELETLELETTGAGAPEPVSPEWTGWTYKVADLFCGAGGTSTGARKAIERLGARMDLVAVNHWPVAVETHQRNHPEARHYVENLETADPEALVPEGWLDILLASPECRYYSRARGGKPVHDQGRMNPWIVQRWLTSLDVRSLVVENVPEFTKWGPLDRTGRPIKALRGTYFQEWVRSLWGLGYQVEWRMLNAADFGDATTRIRFFLLARKDGRHIEWPEATHSRDGRPGLLEEERPRWKAAREIIDWSDQGRSLLDHPKYQRYPLSLKTRRRIARGMEKFRSGGELTPLYIQLLDLPPEEEARFTAGWEKENPAFIVNRHGENGSARIHSLEEPLPTATGRGAGYLVKPELGRAGTEAAELVGANGEPFVFANRNHNSPKGTDEPVPTLTTAAGGGIFLAGADMKPFLLGQQSSGAPRSTEEPSPTIAAAGAIALVLPDNHPFMLSHQRDTDPRGADEPVPTITGRGPGYLVEPIVIQYYGQSHGRDTGLPLSTITKCNKHGLICPILEEVDREVDDPLGDLKRRHLVSLSLTPVEPEGEPTAGPAIIEVNHGNGEQGDRGNERRVHSPEEPLPSQTSRRTLGMASPIIVQAGQTGGNGIYARGVDQPTATLTTVNDMGLVEPTAESFIVPNFGEREGQEPRCHGLSEPLPAVTSHGAGNLATPSMEQALLQQIEESGVDPRRIVLVNGQPFLLDIRFRMLRNAELARAMGFSDEEQEYEFAGNIGEVTKQIGNAVPVGVASALVAATLAPVIGQDGEGEDDAGEWTGGERDHEPDRSSGVR